MLCWAAAKFWPTSLKFRLFFIFSSFSQFNDKFNENVVNDQINQKYHGMDLNPVPQEMKDWRRRQIHWFMEAPNFHYLILKLCYFFICFVYILKGFERQAVTLAVFNWAWAAKKSMFY